MSMSKFIYSLLGFLFATQTQSYQVKIVNTAIISFLPELKLSSRITLRDNFENFENKKFMLYLFNNEEKFKKKIRLQLI